MTFRHWMAVLGPGLVVMLADTDAGSVITASQSGASYGYRLLLLQFAIIPLLYMVQELTIRLGLCTGRGYVELIMQRWGKKVGWFFTLTLLISCLGALTTELSGLVGAGQLLGMTSGKVLVLVTIGLLLMVWTGSYRSVERVAICLGLGELAFLVVAWRAHPNPEHIRQQLLHLPWHDKHYLYLLAANLGTSIMPWTVFYQQSALTGKGMGPADIPASRLDTLSGAILCQLITAAILVAAAATFGHAQSLDSIPQIGEAFSSTLGHTTGTLLFTIALSGGALVAMIVVCLSCVWSLGEAMGMPHDVMQQHQSMPWQQAGFSLILLAGVALTASGTNLLTLSLATGVLNALLLPIVLAGLYWMARTVLPATYRLQGSYALCVAIVFIITAGIGLYSALEGGLG